MESNRNILSSNIKFLRKAKGLNQDQLANMLNIKRSNIAAYETKNVEPRLRTILDIARFFDVDISTLLKERLAEGTVYLPFANDKDILEVEPTVMDIDSEDVQTFVTKSMKIKKILIGFKSFYAFRKSKLKELSPSNEKVIFDIDNFIQLMDDLISHNESMVTLLSSKTK